MNAATYTEACPVCANPATHPISYGLTFVGRTPDPLSRGCLRPTSGPDWYCPVCGNEWAAAPPDGAPCPDCDQPLRQTGPTSVQCPQCRYTNNNSLDPNPPPDVDQTDEQVWAMFRVAHDRGRVQYDDETWASHDDAVAAVGAEETARLRDEMAAYLDKERRRLDSILGQQEEIDHWAQVNGEDPIDWDNMPPPESWDAETVIHRLPPDTHVGEAT